ncbi:hypothetical protein [Leisingera methylohalidivorans]|uniref:Argininosuccinate lyase n=1 Tax=Leisingera methylohalidivorans DSM 14336 TaxID=999552 RepID=V9VPI9_9RHOB|nr:hypothetical protein [Leisingera methylohalidivorans]AHD00626.1 hypothetical protein METH_07900 [Leisingera methylohalidivorans DSM 14336]
MKPLLTAAAAAAVFAFQAPAYAEDLQFQLINDSSADLVEFNVSSASSDSWESNLLEGGYLAPGYEIGVLIADGATTCVYDIRGSFSDGSEAEDYGLDLCEMGGYTFTD